jgi:tripartite-type tricarboxylate transporter receptor subunit TctC
MSIHKVVRIAGVAMAFGVALAASAHADNVADFYKGKTFQFVVGYPPSGGYDAYSRLLVRFLGKHIPGQPTVILQNMPGHRASSRCSSCRPSRRRTAPRSGCSTAA